MTNSFKKLPICGHTCAESDKSYKVQEHKRERRYVRQVLNDIYDDDEFDIDERDFGNPWASPKDGKQWVRRPERIYDAMRK